MVEGVDIRLDERRYLLVLRLMQLKAAPSQKADTATEVMFSIEVRWFEFQYSQLNILQDGRIRHVET